MLQLKPDREAFERVCKEIENGGYLTCKHIIDVFGFPATELFLLSQIVENNATNISNLLEDIKNELKISNQTF